jgi:hypothetical protein
MFIKRRFRMYRKLMKVLTCAVAALFVASTLAMAQAKPAPAAKATGTVTVVTKEHVTVKGADGKEYKVDAAKVVQENLKTGDIVEYEIVEAKPVNVKKKAK